MRGAALLVSVVLSTAGPAAAQECRPGPVEVVVDASTPAVDVQDVREVVGFTPFPYLVEKSLPNGWTINGLAIVKPEIGYQVQGYKSTNCYRPVRVFLKIGFADPMKVFVASKYLRSSCQYSRILSHEYDHVNIFLTSREAHLPRIRAAVTDAATRAGMAYAGRPDGEEAVKAAVDEALDVTAKAMWQEAATRNHLIDTVDSYRRIQAMCPDW